MELRYWVKKFVGTQKQRNKEWEFNFLELGLPHLVMVCGLPGGWLMSESKDLLFGKAQGAQIFYLFGDLDHYSD